MAKDEYDFRFDIGVSVPLKDIRFRDKERLVSLMTMHYVVLNVKAELDQLLCGMSSTFQMLELVRAYPHTFRPLFLHSTPVHLHGASCFMYYPRS